MYDHFFFFKNSGKLSCVINVIVQTAVALIFQLHVDDSQMNAGEEWKTLDLERISRARYEEKYWKYDYFKEAIWC